MTKHYSKQGLWSLFLTIAFPLRVWTIVPALRDFSWVAERTNTWDAVGVVSYGLLLAFVESFFVLVVTTLFGFFLSIKWDETYRITILGTLVFIASLWAILSSLFFLWKVEIPGFVVDFLVHMKHPLRFLYVFGLALAGLSVSVPTYLLLQSKKFFNLIRDFF